MPAVPDEHTNSAASLLERGEFSINSEELIASYPKFIIVYFRVKPGFCDSKEVELVGIKQIN